MQFDLITVVYIAGGLILPLFYLPQIRRCHLDNSGLASFSMTKTAVMTGLRLAMLPFVLRVGNDVMSFIVMLDTAGRLLELLAAVRSLQRQGWTSREILLRMLPSLDRSRAAASGAEPGTGTAASAAPAMTGGASTADAAPSFEPPPPTRIASGFMYLEPAPASADAASHGDDDLASARLGAIKVTMRTPA